jgi:hypothetical protein
MSVILPVAELALKILPKLDLRPAPRVRIRLRIIANRQHVMERVGATRIMRMRRTELHVPEITARLIRFVLQVLVAAGTTGTAVTALPVQQILVMKPPMPACTMPQDANVLLRIHPLIRREPLVLHRECRAKTTFVSWFPAIINVIW